MIILIVFAYFFSSALELDRQRAKQECAPLTVEEKAEVLRSLTQTSEGKVTVTPSEAAERLRTLESVAQSSSDSPAAEQSDAEKAKILESLQSP